MLGTIIAYSEDTGKGLVDDGQNTYLFDTFSIQDEVRVYKGMAVYFELNTVKTYIVYMRISKPLFKWAAVAVVILALCACGAPKDGAPGDAGKPGTDASIGTVQFCPKQGATTTGHFPEYGLCINNILYGVFDDSFHTWLAQVIPGTYTATSTGLQCTFTVSPNCVVQQ